MVADLPSGAEPNALKKRDGAKLYHAKLRQYSERGLRTRKPSTAAKRAELAKEARASSSVGKAAAMAAAFGGKRRPPQVVVRNRPPKLERPAAMSQPASRYADIDQWIQDQELIGDFGTGETRGNAQMNRAGKRKHAPLSSDTREFNRVARFDHKCSPQLAWALHKQRQVGRSGKDASLAVLVGARIKCAEISQSPDAARRQAELEEAIQLSEDAINQIRKDYGSEGTRAILELDARPGSVISKELSIYNDALQKGMTDEQAFNVAYAPAAVVEEDERPPVASTSSLEPEDHEDYSSMLFCMDEEAETRPPEEEPALLSELVGSAEEKPHVAVEPREEPSLWNTLDHGPSPREPSPLPHPPLKKVGAPKLANNLVCQEYARLHPPPPPAPFDPRPAVPPTHPVHDPANRRAKPTQVALRGIELKNGVLKKVAEKMGYTSVEHDVALFAGDRDDRLVCNRNITMVREDHEVRRVTFGLSRFKIFMYAAVAFIVSAYSLFLEGLLISELGVSPYMPFYLKPLFTSQSTWYFQTIRFLITCTQAILFYQAWHYHNVLAPTRDKYVRYTLTITGVIAALRVAKFSVPLSVVTILEFYFMLRAIARTQLTYHYSPHALSMLLSEMRGCHVNSDVVRSNAYMQARRLTSCMPISDIDHVTIIDGTVTLLVHLLEATEPDFTIGRGLRATFVPVDSLT